MTRKAVFLHGTNGDPSDHWWPWLREQFEQAGYEVWAPKLPNCDRPDRETYYEYLTSQNWDFDNCVLVGHSSGATTILNMLAEKSFPCVSVVVLAGVFLNERLTKKVDWYEEGQFDNLFPRDGFRFDELRQKSDKFYFVHADDDPYCSYEDAISACNAVEGEMITVPSGGHLSTTFGITELPQLVEVLKRDSLL